jgi:hypothetical protein
MLSIPFRHLQDIPPSTLRKKLTNEGKLLLTVNNKPIAVMISLDDENAQNIVQTITRLRAQMAVRSIRSQARKNGLNKMSLKEVNDLINRTRAEQQN